MESPEMKLLPLFILSLALFAPATAELYRLTPSQTERVQGVLDRLEEGDTVIFERGTYQTKDALVLKNKTGVELRASGKVEIVLNSLEQAVLEIENCQDIRISGLRARHQKPNREYACEGAVISVRQSEQVGISGCELNGCGAAGVYANQVKDLVVFDNKIFNNTFAGVWLSDTQGHIYRNRLYDNAADFVTSGECDVVMRANKVEKNDGNDFMRSDFFDAVVNGR